ncbi:MAG: helix-turn-helix transcriptional regulator [Candidatus Galacturonibacter soehngenii]|nr:helix-turn-helix transcriptional regulator [Candidatus Galacturonibacter soehngenii]
MRKRIFFKYIVAFASFFIVPLILLFMCLQYIMYANLEKDIMTYNQNILERLGDDVLTINSRLMESGNAISFSQTILSDLSLSANQAKMIKVLMKENVNNPYSKKMYLFYNEGEYTFSSSGKYSLDDLLENKMDLSKEAAKQFLETVFQGDNEKARYITVQKTYELNSTVTTKNQLMFIYPVKNYTKNSNSWIVMEVNENNLSSSIDVAPGNYSKGIFIANYEGDVLFSQNNIDYSKYIDKIDQAIENSAFEIKVKQNEKVILHPIEKIDMILGDVITTPNLYLNVLKRNTPLVTFVLSFLLFGSCFAIYTAYRYYKPIRQLAQYMSQENDINTEVDEFTYMKTQYDKVNSLKEQIAEELEKQWPMVEEHIITQLLYDGTMQEEESDMVKDIIKSQMANHHFIVYTIQEENMTDDSDSSCIHELYKRKEKEWKKSFSKDFIVYTTYLYYYNAVAIILGGERSQLIEENNTVYEGIKNLMLNETLSFAIGSGDVHENVGGIHISFLEAMASIQYSKANIQKSGIGIIKEEADVNYEKQITTYQIENLLLIKGCLNNGNIEEIDTITNKVVLNMEELPEYMKLMCCYDIMNQLIRELPKYHIPISELKLFEMTRFQSSQEFGEKLKEVLYKVCQSVSSIRQDRQDDLIHMISQYIDQNFNNPNLSLVEMADTFHFSSSYLSKFIAQNFNESFTDIVTRKRVEYTKICLIETEKQIAQIAREAGYGNISNFTRRFKSLENMTPGQYRSLYKKEE